MEKQTVCLLSPCCCAVLLLALGSRIATAQEGAPTYAPPPNGDYGGIGPFDVFEDHFTNPVYPTANGETLVVSVFHPNATINPSLPTIFFAHGFASPIGYPVYYGSLLTNLASRGNNVVFSPYEGGSSPNAFKRFDELTTGFEAAVTSYHLNTNLTGFTGHSYGAGFLPAVVQHEMMGKGSFYSPTIHNTWGKDGAFMFSMSPSEAYGGGGEISVADTQTIYFPANLNVIEQVFYDDTSIADPRLAIDIFYNITTLNSQKEFLTVHGDDHGTPAQVASHLLPNPTPSSSLQAWAILRHIDALADYTFTGNISAWRIALGNGAVDETYVGAWSDGVSVVPTGATDIPNPSNYPTGPFVADWNLVANPRLRFPLVSGPPQISGLSVATGQAMLTVSGLLIDHNYLEQVCSDFGTVNWSNALSFVATQSSQSFTNAIGNSVRQFWRIQVP